MPPGECARDDAALEQCGANHQEAVAPKRIFFGAHQRKVPGARQFQQAIDARREIRRLAARGVIDAAIGTIHARIFRASAQRFPEKLILDFGETRSGFQRLAIELRETEAAGRLRTSQSDSTP